MTLQDERLTSTGSQFEFFNGVPDWVFEEEVFEDGRAVWWAPDGQKLVWGSYNDSEVENIFLKTYGQWNDDLQYPLFEEIHYPKVE